RLAERADRGRRRFAFFDDPRRRAARLLHHLRLLRLGRLHLVGDELEAHLCEARALYVDFGGHLRQLRQHLTLRLRDQRTLARLRFHDATLAFGANRADLRFDLRDLLVLHVLRAVLRRERVVLGFGDARLLQQFRRLPATDRSEVTFVV